MKDSARGTIVMAGLMAVTAGAMILPAALGFTLREHESARAFLYSASLLGSLAGLIYLSRRNLQRKPGALSHPFYILTVSYLVIPLFMALPVTEAMPGGLPLFDAWFEMVSAFTTTGASALDSAMPRSLLVWRAMAAWLGGLFVLVYAAALLAPMNMGGYDLLTARSQAIGEVPDWSRKMRATQIGAEAGQADLGRLWSHIRLIAPAYAGVTGLLWVVLSVQGMPPLVALVYAMSTLSTSGIVPHWGAADGIVQEVAIALFLGLALTRRGWPGAVVPQGSGPLWRDDELRVAIWLLVAVTFGLWAVNGADALGAAPAAALAELWGTGFTALSFLGTAGFVSTIGAPEVTAYAGPGGIVLLGLATLGGGIATTAGGLKLLRGFALLWQAKHEAEKLIHPSGMGGDGPRLRGLRSEGAFSAWLFLMVFILTLTALVMALVLLGQPLEDALIFASAAITTTGPLAQIAGPEPLSYAALADPARAVLALGMILGRLELLMLLSVLWPRLGR
ncbi:MAG: trk system potassium uptake protein TrkH [Roseibaca calidilacus]|uniref:Trk system potassium uptake protein TrkH n=1 Tax=Roseibaca calidilacus TaxID=1666912 RepID=A0A0P7Z1W2_9RHOB|nr:potassium transporter TrkG [Roseibaca calidilacus]KPP95666.1 MAG: trk system potassium uptake protein TrkH [Roseibaca calidilacus]CUX81919.1 trk system potassium uptake protein TrkH [Roseibaca calidilacus]